MEKNQLHELATDFLEPLISGAVLDSKHVSSVQRDGLVALLDPCTILFKAHKKDSYRLILRRSQSFEKVKTGAVTESDVVDAFVRVVNAMKNGLKTWYNADLRTTFPRRVVVKALCNKRKEEESVLAVIDQLSVWAGQQYEGKPIPAAIGFVPEIQPATTSFREMCRENFSAVISNGFDTVVTCNFQGNVVGHETLNPPTTYPVFAPYRLGAVADWAKDGRMCIVLNRTGEILIFRDQALRFTRRSGQWHFLTHAPVITQMGHCGDKNVRQAVYATCLDASFARTGACIGVVLSSQAKKWKDLVVSEDDYLTPAQSIKAKVFSPIIGKRKFQDLDRRLRQEIVSIDGATLLDHKGTVLAIGAILKIPGGSTGGGRLAAAKALSTLGVGIKVSQDGKISGFYKGSDEPKFIVM